MKLFPFIYMECTLAKINSVLQILISFFHALNCQSFLQRVAQGTVDTLVMNGSPHSKLDSQLHQLEKPAAVCRVEGRHRHQMVADQGIQGARLFAT
jgi:hypothetical protein